MKQQTSQRQVFLTVDIEPDCPPFLWTTRGLTEGLPRLLDLLEEEDVRATFFCTGACARDFPDMIDRILENGHEVGSHGFSHTSFAKMSESQAAKDIADTGEVLRQHCQIVSFRAPYLQFPEEFRSLLVDVGIEVDASLAVYKMRPFIRLPETRPVRLMASITSSALRLPKAIRNPWLAALADPLVVFVHPWEFVDLRDSGIRWDCRAGTGEHAINSLRSTIAFLKRQNAQFHLAREYYGASS